MPQQLRPVDSSQSDGSQRPTLGMSQATKPLPRLPRGWSRVCHETGLFLRSIGLGILVTACQGFFTNNFLEPEKVAVRQSRVTAFLRALIHILPLGLAIFEIFLNWKGHYVGAIFDKQNYLQFVAKAHEIFIQASLATIVLSYIRYQIGTGAGMPFGAMLGALQFFQVSYLWSVEFWSAILSKKFQLRKKLCFAVLILFCVVIAATAGPSSANLLIAQQGIWPEKSNYLAINATFPDIWPNRLDSERVSTDCKTITPAVALNDSCPISALYPFMAQDGFPDILDTYEVGGEQLDEFRSLVSSVNRYLQIAPCFYGYEDQVCSTFPQNVLTKFGDISEALFVEEAERSLDAYRVLEKEYYQPYTTGTCVADTVQNSSDQAPLRFPRLLENASEIKRGQETFMVLGLTKGQSTYNIPGNITQFRVGWVDLPHEIFGTEIPGAIIVHPQSSSDLPYNITTCTLNAGWGSSLVSIDTFEDGNIESAITETPPSWHTKQKASFDAYGHLPETRPLFQNTSQFSYPQLHINISKSWMEFLNPNIIQQDKSTINMISVMLSQLAAPPESYQLSLTLNLLFVAALSETGNQYYSEVFEERAHALEACETCLVYEIEVSFYGWGYAAGQTTTRLAIAVMFTYCILVLAHLIYSAISGVSSTAWDSVAELVALAMNSSPTKTLQNTCAGIIGRTALQTNVRVLKTSEKHLELVFGEAKIPNASHSKLAMNEKYGSIAEMEGDEDELLEMEVPAKILEGDLV